MKKLINIIKNGTEYQVGAVTEEQFSELEARVSTAESDIDSVEGRITTLETTVYNWDTDLYIIADQLPTENISTTKIYVIPNTNGEGNNIKEEWAYISNKWELIGAITEKVQQHEFLTKEQYTALATKNQDTIYAIYKEITE